MQSPRVVLTPNLYAVESPVPVSTPTHYDPRPLREGSRHKHTHSRGSSVSSLQVPTGSFPQTNYRRPTTPDTPPEQFDPQVYASLQQQYLELLAQNQILVHQHQQQQFQMQLQQQYPQHQYNLTAVYPAGTVAFLSPPRTPTIPPSSQYQQQYAAESPGTTYLYPIPQQVQDRHPVYGPSPRRSRFDTTDSTESSSTLPSSNTSYNPRSPSPATNSPSPASSESSWRRGHRRGKSSISVSGVKQLQPVRQPYGPPPMEKLIEEKAKKGVSNVTVVNFASRIRARAVSKLIQKSLERAAANGPPLTARLPPSDMKGKEAGSEGEEDYRDPKRRSALF